MTDLLCAKPRINPNMGRTVTNRRSYPVPPKPTAWDSHSISCMLQWLYQDVSNRVIPNWSQNTPYEISTQAFPEYEVERGLDMGQYAQGVEDFILGVTLHLLMNHEVWIEVASDSGEGDEPRFRVHEANRVERDKGGRLIQHIPHQSEMPAWVQSDRPWPPVVELDPAQMVHVQLPSAYPSELLLTIMVELAGIEPLLPPSWVHQTVDGTMPNISIYSVNEAHWQSRLLALMVSQPIGWTAREGLRGPGRRLNDYYYTLREMRFVHFIAALRERAEHALRQVLSIAGDVCGFDASVTAFGVYTPNEVLDLIERFQQGEITLADSLDIVFQRDTDVNPLQRRVV